jgi:hypothetical protein
VDHYFQGFDLRAGLELYSYERGLMYYLQNMGMVAVWRISVSEYMRTFTLLT